MKKTTVRIATKEAFNLMNKEFSLIDLIQQVRMFTGRPMLTDGTITRRLRELRSDYIINYRVVDNMKAKYEKLEV